MTVVRLITVGLAHYTNRPDWEVHAAADSVRSIESLFAAHGFLAENWTNLANTTSIARQLAAWARREEESGIVYWTGHGEFNGDGYFLALADSEEMTGNDALSDRQVSSALLQLERRWSASLADEWVLLLLDTCGSRGGAWKIWTSFRSPPRNVGVVATTDDGAAYSGAFPAVLAGVLDGFNGNDTDAIPVNELLRRLGAVLGDDKVNGKFEPSAVLPIRRDAPPALQAPVNVYNEVRKVLADAPTEIRDHFYAKARGAELGEAAWNFTGRVEQRRRISAWLRTAPNGMLVVTGSAGCGKSALIGMILASADPKVRAAISATGCAAIPNDLRPDDLVFDAVLHLTGQSVAAAVSNLAAQLDIGSLVEPDALVAAAREAHIARRTVLVDALDEARDPLTIAALLRQLASVAGHRVLVGTRRSLEEDLDRPNMPDSDVLDVLGAAPDQTVTLPFEPEAVRSYIVNRLQAAQLPVSSSRIAAVAKRICDARQPFLFARLAVHELLADPAIAQSDDALDKLLAAGHVGIFERAVDRLAAHAPRTESLLHVLAYARGRGFPRTKGIWEAAAASISMSKINDMSVTEALELAAPYIMCDSEAGQTVFRLAHRAFSDAYRRRDLR
jgi:hypothetical protein